MKHLFLPVAAICALASPVLAQTAPQAAPPPPLVPQAALSAPRPTQPARPAAPMALADDDLSQLNAKQGTVNVTVLSDQDLTAVNRGNTITANTVGSGAITMGPGAFEGFGGVGNFVINSGHNNNLQGAITINVISP